MSGTLSSSPLVVGLDFGTEAVRALVLRLPEGHEVASACAAYDRGVLSTALPDGTSLARDWAVQDPDDWLTAMTNAVQDALAGPEVDPAAVVGIGVGFTSCTILPTTRQGEPLCRQRLWTGVAHAWPKLWKHHAAQAQADEMNELAAQAGESWLARYGGRVSSEWMVPKLMQIVDEAPAVYAAAGAVVEGGDWIVWQLTGAPTRNACAAGFKALWHRREGYPSQRFLARLRPELRNVFNTGAGAGRVAPPGRSAGKLLPAWAEWLGLPPNITVATAIIDAHAGLLGAGIAAPGRLYLAAGTSTCHLLLGRTEAPIPGISGVVEDGVLEGMFAYEAGQASAGDMLGWYARLVGRSHGELTATASRLGAGESGLLAVDWWNGCRTPLVDADLRGVIVGLTLATPVEAVYRALLEATAFGTKLVIETLRAGGLPVESLVVGGGLAENELLMQLYADVSGLPVAMVSSPQPSARGAALLAAAAAGEYENVAAAVGASAAAPGRVFEPDQVAGHVYAELYDIYRGLVLSLGEAQSPLKRLAVLSRCSPPVTM